MVEFARYVLNLIDANPLWVIVNILIPIGLPVYGACINFAFGSADRTPLWTLVTDCYRYGQLGWLGVAWTCSAFYDGWQRSIDNGAPTEWMTWGVATGMAILLFGPPTAALSAQTRARTVRHMASAWLCLALALASAAMLVAAHI